MASVASRGINNRQLFLYATAFLTGAAVLIIEILGTRILAPFYGSTIFVWSSLITTALAFLALGYVLGGKQVDRKPQANHLYLIVLFAGISFFLVPLLDQTILNLSDPLGLRFGPLLASVLLFSIPLMLLGTVTPYTIRLVSKSLERSGNTAGTIFAIATLGSLAGALLAGFFLLPLLSLTAIFNLTGLLLACIGLAGLIINRIARNNILKLGAIVAGALVLSVFAATAQDPLILAEKQNYYGNIKVAQRGKELCLYVDATGQSCTVVGQGSNANYINQIKSIISQRDFNNILVLGAGGGVLIGELGSQTQGDAVEIDPDVISLAKKHGIFPEGNFEIIIDDARRYLRKTDSKYDLVIVDLFRGANLPYYMFSTEVFTDLKNVLLADGVVFFNLGAPNNAADGRLIASIYQTLKYVFGDDAKLISSSKKGEYDVNVLITKGTIPDSLFAVLPQELASEGIVYRDDFNTVEYDSQYLSRIIHQSVKETRREAIFAN